MIHLYTEQPEMDESIQRSDCRYMTQEEMQVAQPSMFQMLRQRILKSGERAKSFIF